MGHEEHVQGRHEQSQEQARGTWGASARAGVIHRGAPGKEKKPRKFISRPQTAGASQAPSLELWGSFGECGELWRVRENRC